MSEYIPGHAVRLSASFISAAGAAVDPTNVLLRVKDSEGTSRTYGYPDHIVKDAVGLYHYDFVPSNAGKHIYRFDGTGNMNAAIEGSFLVAASEYAPPLESEVPDPGSSGATAADAFTGAFVSLSSTIADNSAILQAAIDARVAQATASGMTIGVMPCLVVGGKYLFTSGVTTRPWVKINVFGNVWLDFSSLSSGRAILIHNDDAPSGETSGGTGRNNPGNGASTLCGINGAFYMRGNSRDGSVVGIRVGPDAYVAGGQYATRDVRLDGVRLSDFGVGIEFGRYNTYLAEVRDFQIHRCGVGISTVLGATGATNSGERMTLSSGTIGSSLVGFRCDNDTAWTLNDVSIDFATGEAAILFGENTRYNVHYLNNLHLEGATGAYIRSDCLYSSYTKDVTGVTSGTAGRARFAALAHGYWIGKVVHHTGFADSGYNGFLRVVAKDTDWYETLAVYGADGTGTSNALDETHNPHVLAKNLHLVTGNSYAPAWPNAPAQALFTGNMTLAIDGLFVGGYGNDSASAAGMFMIADTVNILRARDVHFTGWRQMLSSRLHANNDPYFEQATVGANPVTDPIPTWSVPTGGYSGMDAEVDSLHAWGEGTKSVKFTRTGGSNFYVLRGDRFNVQPGERLIANVAVYGGTSTGGQIAIGFVFWSSSNADLPILKSTTGANTLAQLYEDNTDPAYTGDRLWFAMLKSLPHIAVPPGYDQASIEITVAAVDSGSLWVSYAGANRI